MTQIRSILMRHGIQQHIIEAVLLDLTSTRHRKKDPSDVWNALLFKARAAKLSVTSNRGKRAGQPINHLYEKYLAQVQSAINKILSASTLLLEDGEPVQPRDIEVKRRATNVRREADGKPLLAECHADAWHTWVAPAEREALIQEVARFYEVNPTKPRGKRFVPYVLTADKVALNERAYALQEAINVHRNHFMSPDSDSGQSAWGATPYAALQVRACAAATAALATYMHDVKTGVVDPLKNPLPKDWKHLPAAELRTRMRLADADPIVDQLTDYERRNYLLTPTPDH